MIAAGTPAPDFELRGRRRRDRPPVGPARPSRRPLLLPARRHARRTAQACGIRDTYGVFRERGAVVLGVSPDDEASHRTFKSKYELPFTLLADPDREVAERYGVWVERMTTGGEKRMGIRRSSFVIDPSGSVAKALCGVKPEGHAELVLDALPR